MIDIHWLRLTLFSLALLLALAAPATADAEWSGELGVLVGRHDNFFYRGGGNPAPSSDLVTGSVAVEGTQEAGDNEWTFGLAATLVSVADISDADYQSLGAVIEYKRGPWKAALNYEQLLNRLFSESGEAVFFDESSVDLWLRYSINRRVWVRLRTEVEDWNFDPLQNARDADVDKYEATVRVAATERLGVRLSLLQEDRVATGAENNRSGSGWALALEGAPRDDLTWFFRYRSRDRNYDDAPPLDSNFRRSDSLDDITANVRWLFAEKLGLMVRDSYRSGDSTRQDRNFSGNLIEAGVFFQFGSEP